MSGIPSLVVTRKGFEGIVSNAFASYGFPAEAPMGFVFPAEMFLEGSDLSPIEANFDALMEGLTEWQPEMTTTGMVTPEMVTVQGDDYPTAIKNVNNLFARNQWRDSLLIEPPTEELVDWLLTGTDADPDEVISSKGGVKPRGGIAKVRDIAVALGMAGGRPEYMPIMIAAVKAITKPESGCQSWNTTTCSIFPVLIVNGPIAKQIRLGSGYGMLGADPAHPAGQVIGRAIRLILQNMGGALPGTGTMSIFGIARTTNAVFAEDEEGVPEGWTTLAEDRGFKRDQNVLTLTWANGISNILWDFGDQAANERCLMAMAGQMAAPNNNRYAVLNAVSDPKNLPTGVCLMARSFAEALSKTSNMKKSDVKKFLWENSMISRDNLEAWKGQFVLDDYVERDYTQPDGRIAVTPNPEQLTVVVGGGDQGGHGCWMQNVVFGEMHSEEIALPSAWDDLMLKSEIDIGAVPSMH